MSQLRAYLDGEMIWKTGTSDKTLQIKDPKTVDQFRKVPTLSFTLPPTNAGHGEANPITSRVTVYEDGVIIFHGRPLTVERTFDRQEKIVCESSLGFLRDTYEYYREKLGVSGLANPLAYLYGAVLTGVPGHDGYNELCDSGNEVYFGVGYEDSLRTSATLRAQDGRSALDYIMILTEDYPSAIWMSWAESNGSIVSSLNFAECALMASEPLTQQDGQQVKFGKNLISLTEDIDTTKVFTKIRGYDTTHSTWFDYYVQAHVNAYGSIKIGKDFDTSGYSDGSYGRTQEAKKYYGANAYPVITRTVKALDGADLGESINRFRVGYYYDVISAPHGINERMMCQKITRYLDDPSRSSYEFGQVKRTLTGMLAK